MQDPLDSTSLLKNDYQKEIDITFENISYQVKTTKIDDQPTETKKILNNLTGIFRSGEITAIMGASGAGKTTLLSILSGRISSYTGKLYANAIKYDYSSFGDFGNYVRQNDVLMETLTVRETLQFASSLRQKNKEIAQQRIRQLVKTFKLQNCLDVMIGGVLKKGISGGQRKRTSIIIELISQPQVLVLDQPTSGLDSLTSYIVINELKQLAHQMKKTIFLTIHQPNSEIYALFDKLMLISEGRFVYQGQANKAINYFTDKLNLKCPEYQNPAEFFISILYQRSKKNQNRKYFDTYEKEIKDSIDQQISLKRINSFQIRKSHKGFFETLIILMKRDYLNSIRNPLIGRARIFSAIFIAIFIGGLFFNAGRYDYLDRTRWYSISGLLFFLSLCLFFLSVLPVVLTFPLERIVFTREQNSRMYGVMPYYLSRNLTEIPFLIIVPLIFQATYYWMVGMASTIEQFLIQLLILFILCFTGSSMGLFFGAIIRDSKDIGAILPMAFIPLVLFSGFLKNFDNFPGYIWWIQFISPYAQAFNALTLNEVKYKPSYVNELNFHYEMWPATLNLLAIGIVCRIFAGLFLYLLKTKLQ